MTFNDELAGISGAALGFITGNTKGAYIGYQAGKKLSKYSKKTMSSTPTTPRKRKGIRTPPTPSGRRKLFGPKLKSGEFYAKKPMSSKGNSVKRQVRIALAQSASAVPHKKLKDTLKNKKNPFKTKVSKDFRNKVVKVLSDKDVTGYGRLYFIGGNYILDPVAANGKILPTDQFVFPLPNGVSQNGLFSHVRVGCIQSQLMMSYCIARLFNGLPLEQNPVNINWSLAGLFANPTDATRKGTLKFDVKMAQTTIHMKNLNKATLFIEFYVCKPKIQRVCPVDFTGLPKNNDSQPLLDWTASLSTDSATGGNSGDGAKANGPNISGLTNTKLGQSPEACTQFKQNWSYEKYSVTLEPGQRHTHVVKGETGTYDMSKMFKNQGSTAVVSAFINQSKWEREVFYIVKEDMTINKAALAGGRFDIPATEATDGLGIAFEVQTQYKFSMPEPTGFLAGGAFVANLDQTNTYRRAAYMCDYISSTSSLVSGGTPTRVSTRIDDNNPVGNF